MKYLVMLLAVYVLLQENGETRKIRYEGMDETSIDILLVGRDYEYVSQGKFDAIPGNTAARPPTAGEIAKQQEIQQAVADARNSGKTTDQRLSALIKAVLQ